MAEGEHGDCYYAIADGSVDVTKDDRHVATLERGEGFGEIALLCDVPRTANVTARTDAELLVIERDAFLVAVTGTLRQRPERRLHRRRALGGDGSLMIDASELARGGAARGLEASTA